MIEGLKVVTAEEMARIEKHLSGHEQFMEEAGRKVAETAMAFALQARLPKKVTLLVGKGNNGGDAYAAGIHLLDHGFEVQALTIPGDCTPLNQKFADRFRGKQGKITAHLEGLILDGLLGTGFKGKLDDNMAHVIRRANDSGLPILAIDIPSGLNGTTGEVASIAINAIETVALGFPKIGFFLLNGWNHVGKLHVVDFGLPKSAIAKAESVAHLPGSLHLPKIVRNRHKYQAGYVVGFAGSKALPGALKLTGLAALRAGAGIVRIFHPEPIGEVPFELICNNWDLKSWKEALAKAQSIFIGPGLGRSKKTLAWLKTHLKQVRLPSVIDADALLPNLTFPKNAILTPHRGEAIRLLGKSTMPKEEELFAQITQFCHGHKVIIVLKGAPTFIFAPSLKPVIVPRGDPGMAKAGTGDVLTGILAALLAQNVPPHEAAVLGVTLHALAGEAAAHMRTSYGIIASDLIEFMPAAFRPHIPPLSKSSFFDSL